MKVNRKRISTGILELDEILYGGLILNRSYLVRGSAGTGKTTLGFHFLCQGITKKEERAYRQGYSAGRDFPFRPQ